MATEDKHAKYDATRKNYPRLPGTRLKDDGKAELMERLYSLSPEDSKADLIVEAAQYAVANKKSFLSFRKSLKDE